MYQARSVNPRYDTIAQPPKNHKAGSSQTKQQNY